MSATSATTRAAIEAVWRIEAARLIGGLVRWVRDVDRAEDLAHDALLSALERWPVTGVPDNPGAWLMTTAKHRAIDERRRRVMVEAKHEEIARGEPRSATLDEEGLDGSVGDDVLRLVLIACQPVLSKDARVALTLRLVAGLSTAEISRAYLTSEATIAQRIVRAKRTLTEAKVPFEVPQGEALRARLPPAMEVVYLVFNEGYAATSGETWLRQELCDEAMRLGRVLAGLVPDDAEVAGLLALMELQASRSRARVGPRGEPILLLDQDRSRWDRLLITRGLAGLERAESLARPLGPYTVQAAIAACHARAPTAEQTDWARIVALYDALVELTGSPVVELNRAVAVSMAHGPSDALASVDELAAEPALRDYPLLPAVRGDLLLRLGRRAEARRELERAARMTTHERAREQLLSKAASCGQ
ncbi:MAG: RNA polymerase sigma factor [Polyangiaceae bacterium]|jgi:RNA polymerase sigma-70 factor (ECF subfamily)|nr:RNA polymerase sigma factor [Polyangiaceae bacterium]MBK8936449.1 RNA polymerase sigma factor [Polyangiaceae bacterium]